MGVFISVGPNRVVPTQDFLKNDTILFILTCYRDNTLDKLPPPPIVREDPVTKQLVAIDGHNLLAVNTSLEKDTKVYIATSQNDFLEGNSKAIKERNQDLLEKFEQVLQTVNKKNTFKSLFKKHSLGKRTKQN